MAKRKPRSSVEEISLTLGEQRMGMKASAKCYFFYVAPTGRETSFKDCEFSQLAWMRGGREEADGSRVSEMGLNIVQPITIKMVGMLSQFGRPTRHEALYLNLSPDHEKLEIIGLGPNEEQRFGMFVGRAKINEELSGITEKEAHDIFKITVLAGPRVERKDNVRSIIISHD